MKESTKFTYSLVMGKEDGVELDNQMWGFKQLTKFTYILERMGRDNLFGVLNQLIKFTYSLKTDEDNGIRWSDKGYSNNLTKFKYLLEGMRRDDQIRGFKQLT